MLSPIPKLASAARSPATCQPSTGTHPTPLTLRHLTTTQTLPPKGLALPRPAYACVPIHKSQDAPAKPAPFHQQIWNEPKRRASISIARPGQPCKLPGREAGQLVRAYLISMVAMPSNFFLIVSASSLVAFSLIGFGAPSTRSLASFKPSEVTSRTALMV